MKPEFFNTHAEAALTEARDASYAWVSACQDAFGAWFSAQPELSKGWTVKTEAVSLPLPFVSYTAPTFAFEAAPHLSAWQGVAKAWGDAAGAWMRAVMPLMSSGLETMTKLTPAKAPFEPMKGLFGLSFADLPKLDSVWFKPFEMNLSGFDAFPANDKAKPASTAAASAKPATAPKKPSPVKTEATVASGPKVSPVKAPEAAKPAKSEVAKPTAAKPVKPKPAEASDSLFDAPTFLKAAKGTADDLTQIKGIGPKLNTLLNELGIFHFWQIAKLKAEDVAWLDEKLQFKGRITREKWIQQAKALVKDAA